MKQRWTQCIGARLFTSAQLASTVSSKVYQCPNSNFYTSNCFNCKPNMQTSSHSQHACDAYPMTLQPSSASQRQDKSRGLERLQTAASQWGSLTQKLSASLPGDITCTYNSPLPQGFPCPLLLLGVALHH